MEHYFPLTYDIIMFSLLFLHKKEPAHRTDSLFFLLIFDYAGKESIPVARSLLLVKAYSAFFTMRLLIALPAGAGSAMYVVARYCDK